MPRTGYVLILAVGLALTALPVLQSARPSVSICWAVVGMLVGACIGYFGRNIQPLAKPVGAIALVAAALAGQATARYVPEGPWYAGLGGFLTAMVLVIAVCHGGAEKGQNGVRDKRS
jgi:peptidoglycan/LPS O-acetylase OafA/YrhL